MKLSDHDFALDSGERISTMAVDDIHPDHWERYYFARDHLKHMKGPLIGADVFCGAGYGSIMLAKELPCFLLGIDGSADAIVAAGRHHASMNLLFSHKLFPFALPLEHFDFIVSMESIEHVQDGEMFFQMLARSIKPGGRLIISAPNAEKLNLEINPYRWHYRHYTVAEILAMGDACGLRSVTWAGASCNVIAPDGRVVSNNFYSVAEAKLRTHHEGDTITHVFERPALK